MLLLALHFFTTNSNCMTQRDREDDEALWEVMMPGCLVGFFPLYYIYSIQLTITTAASVQYGVQKEQPSPLGAELWYHIIEEKGVSPTCISVCVYFRLSNFIEYLRLHGMGCVRNWSSIAVGNVGEIIR